MVGSSPLQPERPPPPSPGGFCKSLSPPTVAIFPMGGCTRPEKGDPLGRNSQRVQQVPLSWDGLSLGAKHSHLYKDTKAPSFSKRGESTSLWLPFGWAVDQGAGQGLQSLGRYVSLQV